MAASGGKTPKLEFAAAAYDADGRLLNSILNEGLASPDPASSGKSGALFHARQQVHCGHPKALRISGWLFAIP